MKRTIVGVPVLLDLLLIISSGMLFAEGDAEDVPKNTSGNTIDRAIFYQGDYIVRHSPENSSIAIVQVTSTSENLAKVYH
jgi:hypothetical protein